LRSNSLTGLKIKFLFTLRVAELDHNHRGCLELLDPGLFGLVFGQPLFPFFLIYIIPVARIESFVNAIKRKKIHFEDFIWLGQSPGYTLDIKVSGAVASRLNPVADRTRSGDQ